MLTRITKLPEYIQRADSLLTDFERKAIIDYLAEHPLAGDVMGAKNSSLICYQSYL
jgi:hypothetical protein